MFNVYPTATKIKMSIEEYSYLRAQSSAHSYLRPQSSAHFYLRAQSSAYLRDPLFIIMQGSPNNCDDKMRLRIFSVTAGTSFYLNNSQELYNILHNQDIQTSMIKSL